MMGCRGVNEWNPVKPGSWEGIQEEGWRSLNYSIMGPTLHLLCSMIFDHLFFWTSVRQHCLCNYRISPLFIVLTQKCYEHVVSSRVYFKADKTPRPTHMFWKIQDETEQNSETITIIFERISFVLLYLSPDSCCWGWTIYLGNQTLPCHRTFISIWDTFVLQKKNPR